MEARKKSRPLPSRPKASVRKVKVNEVKVVDPVRNEVANVLEGLVYLTESVAKLEGEPRKKASQSKGRPSASRRKVKVNEEDAHIRKEVESVLDGLVYLTESVAKLERGPRRGHRTKSANNVYQNKLKNGPKNGQKNGQKNYTSKILKLKAERRARKSESNVTKKLGINI